ncbi:unnamed protein product [Phyllotreta striolata]|uniref:Ubiquitin-like domain-containing protein n=1 Tax=Phyllotreta striolata TaxID=444603 RepID=A0A9N9TN52_PHYSR|nr:unnamed protein product [Phyllotreta striolata]
MLLITEDEHLRSGNDYFLISPIFYLSKNTRVERRIKMLNVTVQTPLGTTHTIEVQATDTVSDLKKKIYDKELVRAEKQLLRVENLELSDDTKISDAHIGQNIVKLVLKN